MNIDALRTIKDNFVTELQNSSVGKKTSLPFIRHELSPKSFVTIGDTFQTLVIGGSFYQKATMKVQEGGIKILSHDQGPQPSFLDQHSLMKFVEAHINPKIRVVALNFAYPMKPIVRSGLLDGTLVSGSKENTFTDLVGKNVGEEIEQYMYKAHGRKVHVSAANDTICLLLSGLIHHEWNRIAAGVVGTGLNFAIFLDKLITVNLESANFDKFPQSISGKEIDQHSAAIGEALYEKEVSGAYLFRHFNILSQKLNHSIPQIQTTRELEELLTHQDKEISKLAREILDHSASLVAAQIAGILEFSKRDLVFIMQGSLYWKGSKYKETVEKIVAELVPEYHATYEQVLHSDLFGAAKLVG